MRQLQPLALSQWLLFFGISFTVAMIGILPKFSFTLRIIGEIEFRLYWVHLLIILLFAITSFRMALEPDYRRDFLKNLKSIMLGPAALWLALAAWALTTALWAFDSASMAAYSGLTLFLEFYFGIVIATAISRGAVATMGAVFMFAALPHAIIALMQAFEGGTIGLFSMGERPFYPPNPFGFGPQSFRPYALAFHPNILAGHMGMTLLIGLVAAYAARERRNILKGILVVMFIVFLGLLVTLSRVALVFTMAVFIPMALYAFRPRGRSLLAVWGLVGMAAIAMAILATTTPLIGDLYDRFAEMIGDPDAALERILEGVPNTIYVWSFSPVMGIGGYNLPDTLVTFAPPDRTGLRLPAHNVYIYVMAELGIIGMAMFMIALLLPARHLFSSNRMLSLAAAALVAYSLIILFDFYYWWPPPMRPTMFWILGMIWGLRVAEMSTATEPEEENVVSSQPVGQPT